MKLAIGNFPGKEKIVRVGSTLLLKAKKHSPTILIVAGIGGAIGATVLACRATLHVTDILDEHEKTMGLINRAYADKEGYPDYTEKMVQEDKFHVYLKTAINIGELYAPAATVGVLSIFALIGSHYILTQRNAALTAAYAGLAKAFDSYRKRVAEEIGEDREKDIYAGYRETVIEEEVKTKKGTKMVKKTESSYGAGYSIYARVFDKGNIWYKGTNTIAKSFLVAQQSHANDLLKINGYLFLSDVYDMLGFPQTKESRVVGWIYGNGDNYIDFGIFDKRNADFINAQEDAVWLDFNVDGVIYDMI